jgi:hypothetical protein
VLMLRATELGLARVRDAGRARGRWSARTRGRCIRPNFVRGLERSIEVVLMMCVCRPLPMDRRRASIKIL